MFRALVVVLLLLSGSSAAHAEKRVALVIGNGAYVKVAKLSNPPRDADAIEALFRKAGFEVVEAKRDLGMVAMRRVLRDFADRVRGADIAAVFFAGHGMEMNGTNYLVPVDAVLERDTDVEDETVSLERVTRLLEGAKRLRFIILDACRDNPFVQSMRRTSITRSIGRGLAEVSVLTSDTLIAFAAKAGSTAADGEGANSPYTTALVKHLATPGLDLRLALGRVRDEVLKSTTNRQEPHYYGSLGGDEIALLSAPKPAQPPPVSEAAQVWAAMKDTDDQAVLEAFTKQFGDTVYGAMARARLKEVKERQARVGTTPGPGPSAAPAAAPSATAARALMRAFDGTWDVNLSCPKAPDGALGYTRNFPVQVKDGALRGQDGVKGKPNYLSYDGSIEPDGSALISASGLTGPVRYSVNKAPEGTSYSYVVVARFKSGHGTGKRQGGRACDVAFIRR